jgi:spermidine synthase
MPDTKSTLGFNTPAQATDMWATECFNNTSIGFRVNKVLHQSVSEFQALDVVHTLDYGNLMLLDGMVMTTDRDEFVYHEMISHVPLCALPVAPERVLIIGGGDGGTLREVLKHPSVKEAVLCEIDGAVIEAGRTYFPTIGCAFDDPRATVIVGDGVAYMTQVKDEAFDAILIDSADPIGPGVGLFTHEFYNHAKRALKPHGILTAQTEGGWSNPEGMRNIYRVLKDVFPAVTGYHATIPTYPGQLWTWSFCVKDASITPFSHFSPEKVQALETDCPLNYYNAELHLGCFALPNLLKNIIQPSMTFQPVQLSVAGGRAS